VTTQAEYPLIATRSVFDGKVIALRLDQVQMSDGAVVEREVVRHPGAVGVVAIDVDGEPALEAARRELAEEAAVTASEWHVLVDLHPSPGFSDEAIRLFLARGIAPVPDADRHQPEHEEITLTVERVPLDEAVRRIFAGELTNSAAVAGILAAARGAATGWSGLRPADAPWPARPGH
jgi:8-oxo-dGDP phosphatase